MGYYRHNSLVKAGVTLTFKYIIIMRNLKTVVRRDRAANKVKNQHTAPTAATLRKELDKIAEHADLENRSTLSREDFPIWYLKQSVHTYDKCRLAKKISAREFMAGHHYMPFVKSAYNGVEIDLYRSMASGNSYLPALLLELVKSTGAKVGHSSTELDVDLFLRYSDYIVGKYETFSGQLSKLKGFSREHFHLVELKDVNWAVVLDKQFFTETELEAFIPEISKTNTCFDSSIKAKYSKGFWFKVFMAQE